MKQSDIENLPQRTRKNLKRIDRERCEKWGGYWNDDRCTPSQPDLDTDYTGHTAVESPDEALAAFEKYDDWFEYVLETHSEESDSVVVLPCGATKPIGMSSVHQKKLKALEASGLAEEADIMIMSEPAVVIPHSRRLSLPAVNYDFPPKFTTTDHAPRVYDLFVSKLAEWIDKTSYSVFYPYLVSRHQEKFDAAVERADSDISVCRIPGASVNLENGNYSGDLFKSAEDIVAKIEFTASMGPSTHVEVSEYPEWVHNEYADKLSKV